jgi:serine/threonine protein kinase
MEQKSGAAVGDDEVLSETCFSSSQHRNSRPLTATELHANVGNDWDTLLRKVCELPDSIVQQYTQLLEDRLPTDISDTSQLFQLGMTNREHCMHISYQIGLLDDFLEKLQEIPRAELHEVGDYFITHTLNSTATAVVYLAIHKYTFQEVALKMELQSEFTEYTQEARWADHRISHEYSMYEQVGYHPSIISLEHKQKHSSSSTPGGESKTGSKTGIRLLRDVEVFARTHAPNDVPHAWRTNVIIMKAALFQLSGALDAGGRVEEQRGMFISSKLISALKHIHAKDVVHRDVKPDQVLISDTMEILLSDFDLACQPNTLAAQDVTGSRMYMAPEIVRARRHCRDLQARPDQGEDIDQEKEEKNLAAVARPPCDVFSLGVTIFKTLMGVQPFAVADADFCPRYKLFQEGKFAEFWRDAHAHANRLTRHRANVEKKLTEAYDNNTEVVYDNSCRYPSRVDGRVASTNDVELSAEAQDLLERMMAIDVQTRITMAQAEQHAWFSTLAASHDVLKDAIFEDFKTRYNDMTPIWELDEEKAAKAQWEVCSEALLNGKNAYDESELEINAKIEQQLYQEGHNFSRMLQQLDASMAEEEAAQDGDWLAWLRSRFSSDGSSYSSEEEEEKKAKLLKGGGVVVGLATVVVGLVGLVQYVRGDTTRKK